jgi:hypothetical protein
MTDQDDGDRAIGERLRRYAALGAEEAPTVRFSPDDSSAQSRGSRGFLMPAVMFGSVAALAVIAVLIGGGTWRGIGAKPSPTPTPTSSPSSPPSTVASPTPEASPVTITGVLPDPGATPPEGVATLQGITVFDVAAATAFLGLSCDSQAQDPELGATFALQCHGSSAGVTYLVRSNVWGQDYVADIVITVRADADGGTIDAKAMLPLSGKLVGKVFSASNPDVITAFLSDHLKDSNCKSSPCVMPLGNAAIRLQLGENGARVVQLVPA